MGQGGGDAPVSGRPTLYQRYGKRLLDLAGASVLAVAAAPVAGVTAAALWRSQGRPILFRQDRLGLDGHPFTIFKFRTMVTGAVSEGAGLWFDRDDPRITPVGRFLRASSIDELPQVWNVLRGDMSLVGPRPKPAEIVDRYRSRYAPTLATRPGLTCLHAVEGRNTLRRSQMIDADQRYVRRITLRGDLAILARTVPVVLLRKGFHAEDESEEFVEDVPADAPAGTATV
jgi:lipopolysaccharide/colanic/teichoic acid biosynthesis glycosyltransferase